VVVPPPTDAGLKVTAYDDAVSGLATGTPTTVQADPLVADLAVRSETNLWLAAEVTHSAGAALVGPAPGAAGVPATIGLVSPDGTITYRATFPSAGDAVTVRMNINGALAVAANFADILLPQAGVTVTPEAVAAIAGSLKDLAGVARATGRLNSLPESPRKRAAALVKAANDLRKVLSEKRQATIIQQSLATIGVQISRKAVKRLLRAEAVKDLVVKIADTAVLMIQTGGRPVEQRFVAEQA
jgi:hypothetical protein